MNHKASQEAPENMAPITRREALQKLWWIALAVTSNPIFPGGSQARPQSKALSGTSQLLAHKRNAAAIGALFIAKYPNEATIEILVSRLGLKLDSLPSPGTPELKAAATAIHLRHVEDFRADRLFDINGWKLTQTELSLATITYLARR